MPCKLCQERVKDWSVDDPQCAFEDGMFSADNWNCATANAIRDICYEGQEPMPSGVDYRYCEDQKYATIWLSELCDNLDERATPMLLGLALWVSWYKNRGRTEAMWLLDNDMPPRPPTEAECLAIIDHYVRVALRS